MKKCNILIGLAMLTILLAACGGNNETTSDDSDVQSYETAALAYEPEDIDPDTDVCEICAMAIADDEHATQIVLENDRALKFDDLGCLYEWIEENGEGDIGAKFVRDFHTKEWLLLEDATYVFDEDIETPMAYGIISFKEQKDAEDYIKEHSAGEILSANDLGDHKWEMMDHDHDDHDHHGHDDHEHGFHTEGFDMYFTKLENVTASEETALEVHITLNNEELEDAEVRYEVWPEDEEENTDWLDAAEAEAGSYVADYAFETAGTYHIRVHVQDDKDLHEHIEQEVNVKE